MSTEKRDVTPAGERTPRRLSRLFRVLVLGGAVIAAAAAQATRIEGATGVGATDGGGDDGGTPGW
jgi:hypothetical protein